MGAHSSRRWSAVRVDPPLGRRMQTYPPPGRSVLCHSSPAPPPLVQPPVAPASGRGAWPDLHTADQLIGWYVVQSVARGVVLHDYALFLGQGGLIRRDPPPHEPGPEHDHHDRYQKDYGSGRIHFRGDSPAELLLAELRVGNIDESTQLYSMQSDVRSERG
jgi:hypothetical protein